MARRQLSQRLHSAGIERVGKSTLPQPGTQQSEWRGTGRVRKPLSVAGATPLVQSIDGEHPGGAGQPIPIGNIAPLIQPIGREHPAGVEQSLATALVGTLGQRIEWVRRNRIA